MRTILFSKQGAIKYTREKLLAQRYFSRNNEEQRLSHSNIKNVASDSSFATSLAGVVGFEPTECRSQSPMPYRLATPQCDYLLFKFVVRLEFYSRHSHVDSVSSLRSNRLIDAWRHPNMFICFSNFFEERANSVRPYIYSTIYKLQKYNNYSIY